MIYAPFILADDSALPEESDTHKYVSIIREDRYWEYEALRVGESYYLTMKFDGTKELFGKEYHVFTQTALPGQPMKSKNMDFTGTLLREENGKLYVANMSYGRDEESRIDTEDTDYESEEFLLYDFNCNEGDYMPCVITNFNSEACFDNNFYDLNFYPAQNKVEKVEYIDIAGEKCKKFSFGQEYTLNSGKYSFQWPELIEGVGFIDYGILSLPMFLNHPSGGGCYNICLKSVYDGDGNQIYLEPDGVDKLEANRDAISISCEGDLILISAESDNFDVTICSMEGKSLRNYRGSGCLSIDKSDFNKGIYILTVKCGNSVDTRKIIV